jgi:hypothetical protein
LNDVTDDVIPMFTEAAKKLIEKHNGNAVVAISKALAYISGNYKKASNGRSLLTG